MRRRKLHGTTVGDVEVKNRQRIWMKVASFRQINGFNNGTTGME
jgi:hypothetical protein